MELERKGGRQPGSKLKIPFRTLVRFCCFTEELSKSTIKGLFTSDVQSSKRFTCSKLGKNLTSGFAAYCVIFSEVVSQYVKIVNRHQIY